ncbi:DUF998 domain-containing protein [Dactylosporangium sp. NPDC051541]|uniref:DUF998 domain-containing protein n=1 Tax=Dactylosporangium sp. NPDC051541 TaxID=3363977 RepID=UPI0037BB67A0
MRSLSVRSGAACWLLAAVIFLVAQLVVQAAWAEPYSWADHNISDLGNVTCGPWGDDPRYVCSPRHAWMNAALMVSGLLLTAGVPLLRRYWRTRAAPALLLAAALGWTLVGFVPADVRLGWHLLGAVLIFFAGNTGLLLVGRTGWPASLRRLAVVAGALGLAAAALHLSGTYLGLGLGGTERVAAFAVPLWMAAAGLTVLRGRAIRGSATARGSDGRWWR